MDPKPIRTATWTPTRRQCASLLVEGAVCLLASATLSAGEFKDRLSKMGGWVGGWVDGETFAVFGELGDVGLRGRGESCTILGLAAPRVVCGQYDLGLGDEVRFGCYGVPIMPRRDQVQRLLVVASNRPTGPYMDRWGVACMPGQGSWASFEGWGDLEFERVRRSLGHLRRLSAAADRVAIRDWSEPPRNDYWNRPFGSYYRGRGGVWRDYSLILGEQRDLDDTPKTRDGTIVMRVRPFAAVAGWFDCGLFEEIEVLGAAADFPHSIFGEKHVLVAIRHPVTRPDGNRFEVAARSCPIVTRSLPAIAVGGLDDPVIEVIRLAIVHRRTKAERAAQVGARGPAPRIGNGADFVKKIFQPPD